MRLSVFSVFDLVDDLDAVCTNQKGREGMIIPWISLFSLCLVFPPGIWAPSKKFRFRYWISLNLVSRIWCHDVLISISKPIAALQPGNIIWRVDYWRTPTLEDGQKPSCHLDWGYWTWSGSLMFWHVFPNLLVVFRYCNWSADWWEYA